MKKLLLLAFIIPVLCKAQCPVYLNVPSNSLANVTLQIEDIASVNLTLNTDRADRIDYNDAAKSFQIRMFLNDANNIKSISITGKADVIDKLYNTYFLPAANKCLTKQTATYFFADGYKVSCIAGHSASIKEIDVEHI